MKRAFQDIRITGLDTNKSPGFSVSLLGAQRRSETA
jgi:hypothetical protein